MKWIVAKIVLVQNLIYKWAWKSRDFEFVQTTYKRHRVTDLTEPGHDWIHPKCHTADFDGIHKKNVGDMQWNYRQAYNNHYAALTYNILSMWQRQMECFNAITFATTKKSRNITSLNSKSRFFAYCKKDSTIFPAFEQSYTYSDGAPIHFCNSAIDSGMYWVYPWK